MSSSRFALLRLGRVLTSSRAACSSPAALLAPSMHAASAMGLRPSRNSPLLSSAAAKQHYVRAFADKKGPDEGAEASAASSGSNGEAATQGMDELAAELREREQALEELQSKLEKTTDAFKRSLADMENLRQRTQQQLENANKFAVQGFAKAMLEVADNLERAAGAVPGDVFQEGSPVEPERALALLKGLLEGVQITEKVLMQALERNGVKQYNPEGQKFDPNMHNAMFEVPDPSREAGTIAIVHKRGYLLHDRVLRAAEVGVVRAT